MRVWFEGSVWVVERLDSHGVELTDGRSAQRVTLGKLCMSAAAIDDGADVDGDDRELIPVVLGSLTVKERETLEVRASHVRDILSAGRGGMENAELLRVKKARELRVSLRTIERWVAGYREAGVAGLADSRMLGRKGSSVDPRWDAACLRVLHQLVPESTPTISVVIARVTSDLTSEHSEGQVPIPSASTAYRRIKQLSKGRHAFGSAKARRSVAERPKGAYGRLRAARPGEYAVLDTTPLDVFAMEPV